MGKKNGRQIYKFRATCLFICLFIHLIAALHNLQIARLLSISPPSYETKGWPHVWFLIGGVGWLLSDGSEAVQVHVSLDTRQIQETSGAWPLCDLCVTKTCLWSTWTTSKQRPNSGITATDEDESLSDMMTLFKYLKSEDLLRSSFSSAFFIQFEAGLPVSSACL